MNEEDNIRNVDVRRVEHREIPNEDASQGAHGYRIGVSRGSGVLLTIIGVVVTFFLLALGLLMLFFGVVSSLVRGILHIFTGPSSPSGGMPRRW